MPASFPLLAQPVTYSPTQIERVAKLSELYGHIKFFHPYLGYKPINWDSAFAVAAPLVANARTDDETVAAIRQLISVLHDDATTVQLTAKAVAALATMTAADSIQVYFTADSTLVLKTNKYAGVSDYTMVINKLESFIDQLPKARAVLLDLRSGRVIPDNQAGYFQYCLDQVGIERVLAAAPFVTAGTRTRSHSGFVPEMGTTSGGYWSAFTLRGGQAVVPDKKARNCPVVVVVNKQAEFSPGLFALQSQPHVRFVSTEPLSDAQLVSTVTSSFGETVNIRFRTSELVNADGSVGLSDVSILPRTNDIEKDILGSLKSSLPAGLGLSAAPSAPLPVAPPPTLYPATNYPSLGYRLLAGAKIWSVIHYFFAYKELMPTDWNASLRTAIGQLAAAPDSTEYALAVARFYRNVQDSHGFINSSVIRNYVGTGAVPIDIQFVDDKPVITRVFADSVAAKGVRVGDIITEVNGEKIDARIARMSAIQPASNEWTRRRDIKWRLLRSPIGTPIRVKLTGADGREKTVILTSQPGSQLQPPSDTSAIFRVLPGNIGYVNMGRLQTKDVDQMFTVFKDTKAIIFDIRNYPNGTAWSISPHLTARRNVVAARFFRYAPAEPDCPNGDSNGSVQKYYFDQQIPANDGKSVYRGKTLMLIDERTQSQAEHTGLFFEAANGTEFIGSPTAGANGDVTNFRIPGGMQLSFSGHDVRHADGRQLQQVGLQPKILIWPTIEGIRAGKDEVLERAVQYLNTGK